MKPWYAHYKNKYPESKIQYSESSFDVYGKDGEHYVSIRKDGAGQWKDESEEMGCKYKHDLSPLPKSASPWEEKDGKIQRARDHEKKKEAQEKFAAHSVGGSGVVPSNKELDDAGFKVTGDGSKEQQDCDHKELK